MSVHKIIVLQIKPLAINFYIMKKIILTLIIFVFTANIFAQNKGTKPLYIKIKKKPVKLYEQSHALIIGNVNYTKWSILPIYLIDTRDNKRYKIVKIGTQTWMAENLAYKTSSGCWAYDNNQSNVTKYGYLYNCETAKTVCPSGWHLPTKAEFKTLLDNYAGSSGYKVNYTVLIPSGESGFSATFGGWRSSNGDYSSIGNYGGFWSSSMRVGANAWRLYINSSYKGAIMNYGKESVGLSVRCLQNI